MAVAKNSGTGLFPVDYIIIVVFNVISIGIGILYACRGGKQRTNKEFLMGNRNLPTFPVAVSIVASFISGITFLGHPAEIYFYGTEYCMVVIGYMIASGLSAVTIVPLFYELKVTSSFEYIESRFKSKVVKLMGTTATLVNMLVQMGIVIYAPAVALQAVNGIPIWVSITISSVVSVCYTILGGMKAVIYTDVFQSLCVVIGMIAIIGQGTREIGSVGTVYELNERDGRTKWLNLKLDLTDRSATWSVLLSGVIRGLYFLGISQTTVQRFCVLPTLSQAKRSLWLNTILILIVHLLPTALGWIIYAYYAEIECDPFEAKYISNQNQLVPYFTRNVLNYPGFSGALMAVLFGGALSSISSTLNSSAVLTWEDMLKHFFRNCTEDQRTIVTKTLVLLFGIIGIGIAFAAAKMPSHVLQVATASSGAFYGPLLGIFFLGALFPFANSKGAGVGSSIALAINIWLTIGSLVNNPSSKPLQSSIEKCNATVNDTFQNFYDMNAAFRNGMSENNSYSLSFWNETSKDSFNINTETERFRVKQRSTVLNYLYSLSFHLPPVIGLLVTIVLGVIISLLTGGCKDTKPDRRLLIPIFDRVCCCLPKSFRKKLQCERDHGSDVDVKPTETITMYEKETHVPSGKLNCLD